MANPVLEYSAAPSELARKHFAQKLSLETDCWDVHSALKSGTPGFVLLDVRSPQLFAQGHVAGAVNLPHRKIIPSRLKEWPLETVFIVYCAGPHCNGADRAAQALALLNRPVKVMNGGITGWVDEGFHLASGDVVQIAAALTGE